MPDDACLPCPIDRNATAASAERHLPSRWRGWAAGGAASLALASLLPGQASHAAAAPVCRPSAQANKAVVRAFYTLALGEMKPRAAFARYAAPGFIEHSDDGTGSAEGTVRFLEDIIRKSPRPHWDIVRSAAEGDLVFLHVRFTPAPTGQQIAVVEIFRLRQCRLVEHWDVISHPPEHPINRNSRF